MNKVHFHAKEQSLYIINAELNCLLAKGAGIPQRMLHLLNKPGCISDLKNKCPTTLHHSNFTINLTQARKLRHRSMLRIHEQPQN